MKKLPDSYVTRSCKTLGEIRKTFSLSLEERKKRLKGTTKHLTNEDLKRLEIPTESQLVITMNPKRRK